MSNQISIAITITNPVTSTMRIKRSPRFIVGCHSSVVGTTSPGRRASSDFIGNPTLKSNVSAEKRSTARGGLVYVMVWALPTPPDIPLPDPRKLFFQCTHLRYDHPSNISYNWTNDLCVFCKPIANSRYSSPPSVLQFAHGQRITN
jgi:hypothetical protein